MLLYYQSWMFYNHFIVILYHFLVLTYWHSAMCQLLFSACFLHYRKSIPNGVEMQWNCLWIILDQKTSSGPESHLGMPRGGHNPTGRAWASVASPNAYLLYKYPDIPETLGESTKINSSHRKFQKHQIQSRYHHGGVHHVHWCLSDDAWVLLWPNRFLLVQKKIHKKFRCVWTPFGIDFLLCKKQAENNKWH